MPAPAPAIGGIAIAALLALAGMTPARAETDVPLGYLLMCLQLPEECEAGGTSTLVVDGEVAATLERINSSVNRAITPREDQGADVWSVSVSAGDCEDYVLAKRHALIASGLPPSALRIAYVQTPAQEGHAILVVKTDTEDLVLDNLSGSVRSLSESGYHIISMSGPDPLVWS
ncbi:MAG: transglutaminase-like cysteine peptidase [Devosia sp.]|uniref:transglutaminase-like cysteine peptidase n=1 Tax=Devosia sp. TaxID=1871048 RepID=UPI001A4A0463|nr:transglutaminase-like cysteine peptidase [Devosia sp.]MBL8599059.1 transglutaminase-like cysteine peptidase [Devosia sp.]